MRDEEIDLIKKATPNYDDFNIETSWSMKKKFVFAKPGKKRFVSQCAPTNKGCSSDFIGLKFGSKLA